MEVQKKNNVKNKSINILLAEDNEDDIEVTVIAFKRSKIKNNIFVAENGQEALDFIYHRGQFKNKKKYPTPDIILLDINMPKVNGFEVLKELKADDEYNFIPVVMLTSSKNEEDIVKSFKNGAVSYIQKPVKFSDFSKLVEQFNFYWQIINKLPKLK